MLETLPSQRPPELTQYEVLRAEYVKALSYGVRDDAAKEQLQNYLLLQEHSAESFPLIDPDELLIQVGQAGSVSRKELLAHIASARGIEGRALLEFCDIILGDPTKPQSCFRFPLIDAQQDEDTGVLTCTIRPNGLPENPMEYQRYPPDYQVNLHSMAQIEVHPNERLWTIVRDPESVTAPFIHPPEIRGELQEISPDPSPLARVMLKSIGYPQGNGKLADGEKRKLVSMHAENPWSGASALIAHIQNAKLQPRELRSMLDNYLEFHVALDRAAFGQDNRVYNGWPAYIPDGYTSLGSTPQGNPAVRDVEKIGIHKLPLLKGFVEDMVAILLKNPPVTSANVQKQIVEAVAASTLRSYPYDYTTARAKALGKKVGRTIGLDEIQDAGAAVCRHQSLDVQIKLQALGVYSRPLDCVLIDRRGNKRELLGRHACNLVRIGSKWHILDVTNSGPVGWWKFGKVPIVHEPIADTEDPYASGQSRSWRIGDKEYFLPGGHDFEGYEYNDYYTIKPQEK